jgi:low temperature requirement protein LtrA
VTFGVERSSVAAFTFAIALCVWWIYFDFADTSVIGRGRMGLVFVYGHFVVWGGVALIGAGTELAITHATEPELSSSARWALAIGLAGYLLSLAVLHLAAEWTSPRDRAFLGRLVVAALALGVAALGPSLDPSVFVGFLALCLVVQVVLEAVTSPVGAASVWEPSARRREVNETA